MTAEKTLKECFHAALAAINRELPNDVVYGYRFQMGTAEKARNLQQLHATCIWQLLELESIDDFVYILFEIGVPNVRVRNNGHFQGGTELQAYINKNKDLESIVAVKRLKTGTTTNHFCFQPNSSRTANYATTPSSFKHSINEIKDLRMELASRKASQAFLVSPPFDPIMRRSSTGYETDYEIHEDDEKYSITIDVPGVKAQDMIITLEENLRVLHLSGSRKIKKGDSVTEAKFVKTFPIGDNNDVDVDKIAANLSDGVLEVTAPKRAEEKRETRVMQITGL
jgi:HSP20 family protein